MTNTEGMGRRVMRTGSEYDVHTRWRHLLVMKKGETAKVKRLTRRRERHNARRELKGRP